MGLLDIFKKKPIWRTPDLKDINLKYIKMYNDYFNYINDNASDDFDAANLVGQTLVEFSSVDTINLNKLLDGCNISQITKKDSFDFIIKRCAFQVFNIHQIVSIKTFNEYANSISDTIISSVVKEITSSIQQENNGNLVNSVTSQLINSMNLYAGKDIDDRKIYDFHCYQCLSFFGSNEGDIRIIAADQLRPIAFTSSRCLNNFIIPTLVSDIENMPEPRGALARAAQAAQTPNQDVPP